MGLYDRHVLPRLVHLACGLKPTMRQRGKVVPQARGRVLEVGIGSGLNLPFYDAAKVSKVWGLDPSQEMIGMARRAAASLPFEVEFIGLPGDEIPLDDASIDTVVVTYTLCTIPDAAAALRQIDRVLRPGGELIFCEHGEAPDAGVRRWQDRLNPVWKRLAGGCHLNRPIPALIEAGGFRITRLETMYVPGWRPASFNYWGAAVSR
ncbi:MAG: class I SAM-dependent methyltransferase [Betaproteobacteria bacterium]|nr:class I SAM-dependent methyltransferase [Betaproteobacteria bacterium]